MDNPSDARATSQAREHESHLAADAVVATAQAFLNKFGGFLGYAEYVKSGSTSWSRLRSTIWLAVHDRLAALALPKPALAEGEVRADLIANLERLKAWCRDQDGLATIWLHIDEAIAAISALPAPLEGDLVAVPREVLNRRSVPTMDPHWSAAFNAALDMVSRETRPFASAPPAPAGEGAANIVLVSQDRDGRTGYHLHGLFCTFADAARHVAKDQGLTSEQTDALVYGWSKPGDRHESAEVGAWWVAARQAIRATPTPAPAAEDGWREAVERCAQIADKVERAAANEVHSYDSYGGPSLPGREREIVRQDAAKEIAAAIRTLTPTTEEAAEGEAK